MPRVNKVVSNFQQIACHSYWDGTPPLDSPKHGICISALNLKAGKKVTAKVVKVKVNALISFGCGTCGSSPIEPSNNVLDGQIKVDFTRDFCGNGVCNTTSTSSTTTLNDLKSTDAAAVGKATPTAPSASITPRDNSTHADSALLGINCRGSGYCNIPCGRDIWELQRLVGLINDGYTYSNHAFLACAECKGDSGEDGGFCVFPQKKPRGERMYAKRAKEGMGQLIAHGCRGCGSVPLHPGNNVNTGELTVNFVEHVCRDGVC
ncbi:killer toxin [Setomelanomma holmii]|uniref:Killer toxin n=1 Tax=Setomelanomma holmii TaxID=210430 RepID=A0A9P4LQA3_9PLEO|nr:killer toxin [Setomelanomma holmii]